MILVPVLLCDLDDTLFDHDRATRDALADLRLNYQVLSQWSLEELDLRHRHLLETLHIEVLAGRSSIDDARRQRFGQLLTQAGVHDPVTAATLAATYREVYASNWQPVPGALAFLQAIREDGHSVVVITNNGVAEQRLKLERCGMGEWIEHLVTSEEVGVSKPAPEIFEHALARVDAAPSDAVMLGDAWAADVEGARGAGITPVWFNRHGRPSPDPTVAELASLEPAGDAMTVLRRAGLRKSRAGSPSA